MQSAPVEALLELEVLAVVVMVLLHLLLQVATELQTLAAVEVEVLTQVLEVQAAPASSSCPTPSHRRPSLRSSHRLSGLLLLV